MANTPHPLVQLALRAIEAYVREGKRLAAPPESEQTPEMRGRAATFVSLHRQGELRGCIGTFLPTRENVAEEVIENAIAAATRDPRFLPLEPEELDDLEVSVDVLTPPEPVKGLADLDPKVYGVIVERGARRGLLLPDLPQVTTASQQVAIAREKASIRPDEQVRLFRFKVQRYK